MKLDDIEKEIDLAEKQVSKLVLEYEQFSFQLYNEIVLYTNSYSKSALQYLLSLSKEDKVFILRNLNPVIDNILIKMDLYLKQIDEIGHYLVSLDNQVNGELSVGSTKRYKDLLN